jgi:uncharacterized protein with HEPN domain
VTKVRSCTYQAARLVQEFARDEDFQAFSADAKSKAAVLHELLVIGEAVRRLSDEFRQAHPEIAWKAMIGMRNRLIHGYDVVDFTEVWKTVRVDIPPLLAFLTPLVPKQE